MWYCRPEAAEEQGRLVCLNSFTTNTGPARTGGTPRGWAHTGETLGGVERVGNLHLPKQGSEAVKTQTEGF